MKERKQPALRVFNLEYVDESHVEPYAGRGHFGNYNERNGSKSNCERPAQSSEASRMGRKKDLHDENQDRHARSDDHSRVQAIAGKNKRG
jgi:hypothetical protein